MWRPIGWLTSTSDCSVLFIMPAPSTSGIVSPQERCSAKGYESLSQVEIPPRMSPYVWDSCFPLHSHKYWSLILGNITHCIPAILIVRSGFPSYYDCLLRQTIRAVSRPERCQQMAPIHNTALHTSLRFGYNPGINQSCGMLELKQNNASCTPKLLWSLVNNIFKNIFLLFLCPFPSSSFSKIMSTKTKQCRGMLLLHQM